MLPFEFRHVTELHELCNDASFWVSACHETSQIAWRWVPSTSKWLNESCMPPSKGPRTKLGYDNHLWKDVFSHPPTLTWHVLIRPFHLIGIPKHTFSYFLILSLFSPKQNFQYTLSHSLSVTPNIISYSRKWGYSSSTFSSSSVLHNYCFKRTILVEKKGRSNTPMPTWKLEISALGIAPRPP